jgi:hypothetical protein
MSRTVTIDLRTGGSVVVTEPAWCVVDHTAPVGDRTEIVHEGPEQDLTVTTARGEFRILAAGLDWSPLAEIGDRRPSVMVDLGPDFAGFDPRGLRDLAAGLVVHAGRLRDLAARLEQLLAEAGDAQ